MDLEKYKWYILGYIFYVSIVLASIWNERRDFWPLLIIWCITIPIASYVVSHFAQKYIKKYKNRAVPSHVLAGSPVSKQEKETVNESYDSDLVNSWSLIDFAKLHGKMQVGEFKNSNTGEVFKSCIFTDKDGNVVYVSFYSKLGVLTPQQIKEKRDLLKVGLLNTDKYVLYEKWEGWNNVNLEDNN